jgi:putative transposase
MSHSCPVVFLHVIFCTKGREPLIPPEMEERLYAYLGGIAKTRKTPILKINGTCDHLHMLVKLHPDIAYSQLIKEMKSYSTGWMKKENYSKFRWQEGYGAFSCSISHIEPLIKYIENQKIHHKTQKFEDELSILNRKWGTSWTVEEKSIALDLPIAP